MEPVNQRVESRKPKENRRNYKFSPTARVPLAAALVLRGVRVLKTANDLCRRVISSPRSGRNVPNLFNSPPHILDSID